MGRLLFRGKNLPETPLNREVEAATCSAGPVSGFLFSAGGNVW